MNNGESFKRYLLPHLKRRGLTQEAFAAKLGYSKAAVTGWFKTGKVSRVTLANMAKILEVPRSELDAALEGQVDEALILQGDNFGPGPEIRRTVPLISWVQAGPFAMAEDPEDVSACPRIETTVRVSRRSFALRVENDSMSPDFKPGTVIIVDPELVAVAGDYVIVANGAAEATFKQLVKDGDDYMLRPLNPQYPVRPMPDHGRIVGVVVSMERRFR